MTTTTKAGLIRGVLAEGPATTIEVALELDMPRNSVAAQLSVMARRGSVVKKTMRGLDGYRRNLWSLGRAA